MRFEHLMTYRNKDQSGWTPLSFVNEPKEKLLMTAYTYETFILRGFRKSYLVRLPIILPRMWFYVCATVWIVRIVYPRSTANAYAKRQDRARNEAPQKISADFSTLQKSTRGSLTNGRPLSPHCDNLVRRYRYYTNCIVGYTQYIPYVVYVLVLWSCWRC